MQIFEQKLDFPYLNNASGFCFGLIFALIVSLMVIPKKEVVTKYIKVPVQTVKVVKVPVNLSRNDQRQIQCLAENVYYEAGNQPVLGKIAVTNVVLNRTKDDRFPGTPCGVVNQKTSSGCQFSWKCQRHKIQDMQLFEHGKTIAREVYIGNVQDVTGGAKFYHATYVHPVWRRSMERVARIEDHIFYRG
jgi:spore germination cell wall hydrolase CwlJ-like protein